MRPGARLDLRIERLALGGDGIAHADKCVVFVPYACPGDTVHAEITETHRQFARARILRVVTASPQRVAPPCPYHFSVQQAGSSKQPFAVRSSQLAAGSKRPTAGHLWCGGCSWQHIDYPAQLEIKRRLVQETLERIGRVRGIVVQPALGMRDPWRYRNKVQQPVGMIGGRLVSGFYAPDSHDIVPIEDCLVQSELSVRILHRARALAERFRLTPRHFWLRTSAENKALLVFVMRSEDFPHEQEILEALVREFPGLVGIHQNVNPGKTNVILGRTWRKLCGADFLEERLGAMRFLLSPGSFFQVNTPQTEALYDVVKRLAGQGERLLDLYCGVGGIALWLAASFREVIGVDEVPGAIDDAKRNASLNRCPNALFVAESAERTVARFKGAGSLEELTVVLDPPRAGCTPHVLTSVAHLRPSRLIYVSCDPGTLSRDLAVLTQKGYRVREVQPVDLFPHTPHIETVALLEMKR